LTENISQNIICTCLYFWTWQLSRT